MRPRCGRPTQDGLSLYDLPLSATRRPARLELLRLIDVLERCPYPLLIHCKSGADRTGLASALYLMLQRGETPERAGAAFRSSSAISHSAARNTCTSRWTNMPPGSRPTAPPHARAVSRLGQERLPIRPTLRRTRLLCADRPATAALN